MPTFRYSNPEVVHWGPGSVRERLPEELSRLGVRRAFLVTTRSAERDPLLAAAVEAVVGDRLAGRFAGVGQHAPARSIMEAVAAARSAGADGLVSLGGGSPIDAAKATALCLATGIDLAAPGGVERARQARLGRTLPHVAIPTTLSVAELSGSAGFTAEGTREKVGVVFPELRAAAVIYDPELAVRTPLPLWLSSGIRAVDHAVETLLSPGEHPLPDAAAEEGLRRLRQGLLASRARPDDPAPRGDCQVGAWLTYLLPSQASRGLSHTLGKRLGSRHAIPHGVTSCLLLPHVLRRLGPGNPEAAARIARALGASDAADGVSGLVAALDLPRNLSAWKLTEADLAEAVRPVASPEHPEVELLAVLRAAM